MDEEFKNKLIAVMLSQAKLVRARYKSKLRPDNKHFLDAAKLIQYLQNQYPGVANEFFKRLREEETF